VATGRDDHLGGNVGPSKFKDKKTRRTKTFLFAPHKTLKSSEWRLDDKNGQQVLLIKDYEPTEFVKQVATVNSRA